MHYNFPFRVVVLLVFMASVLWLVHFLFALPEITRSSEGCRRRFEDDHPRQISIALFEFFGCFVIIRVFTTFPGIALRVAEIRNGDNGIVCTYFLHAILHVPLYMFAMGSLLCALHLLSASECGSYAKNSALRQKLGWHTAFSCSICSGCFVIALMHGQILDRSYRLQWEKRGAPEGTVEGMRSYTYDPGTFGKEDGKQYPGECPICLQEWDQGDVIKITRCEHAFHEECIAHWLQKERICALCRQDVISCPGKSSSGFASLAATPTSARQ